MKNLIKLIDIARKLYCSAVQEDPGLEKMVQTLFP